MNKVCENCKNTLPVQKAKFCSDKCKNTYHARMKRRRKMQKLRTDALAYEAYKEKERTRRHRPRSERHRRWERNNIEKVRIRRNINENRRKNLPHTLTLEDWGRAICHFENKCVYCGNILTETHKDHFIPVRLGGGLTAGNIVPACPSCNKRKQAKHPLDWLVAQENGLIRFVKISQYLTAQKNF